MLGHLDGGRCGVARWCVVDGRELTGQGGDGVVDAVALAVEVLEDGGAFGATDLLACSFEGVVGPLEEAPQAAEPGDLVGLEQGDLVGSGEPVELGLRSLVDDPVGEVGPARRTQLVERRRRGGRCLDGGVTGLFQRAFPRPWRQGFYRRQVR